MRKYKYLLCTVIISFLLIMGLKTQINATEMSERQVTAIELPQNLNFYLDPENKSGRGQIYSDKYMIRNAGEDIINFSIDMKLLQLDDQSPIVFCSEEWEEEKAEDRSIYMYVMFESENEEAKYVLTNIENLCTWNITLAPVGQRGDTAYISFGGSLSQSEEWKSGELAINALYAMTAKGTGYQVKIEGAHIKLKEGEEFLIGNEAELHIVPDKGYFLPTEIQVYMGEEEIEFTYDVASGKIFLEEVTDDVVIYADAISKALLPDAQIINMENALWSWKVQEGIQAYEYVFLQDDMEISSGRIKSEDSLVVWNWSEGLSDGDYELCLKAIGDNIHCLNSEKGSYSVTVNRELLQAPKPSEEKQGEGMPSLDNMKDDKTPQPSETPGEDEKEQVQPDVNVEESKTPQPSEILGEDEKEQVQPGVNAEESKTPQPSEIPEEEDKGGQMPSGDTDYENGIEIPDEAKESIDENLPEKESMNENDEEKAGLIYASNQL